MGTKVFLKAFFRRIITDFRHKELLPLKLLFFVHSSTVFVLYPYLTIHMRELGINVEETAIMSAVTPVVAIVMPPLAGMVADRIGNFKILLAAFSSLGGASALLLLLVPVGRVTLTYPALAAVSLGCGGGAGGWEAAPADGLPCSPLGRPTLATLQACGFLCDDPPPELLQSAATVRNFTVSLPGEAASSYSYSLQQDDQAWHESEDPDIRAHLSQHLNERFRTSVRVLPGTASSNAVFFPTSGLVRMRCSPGRAPASSANGTDATTAAPPAAEEGSRCELYAPAGGVNATDDRRRLWLSVTGAGSPQHAAVTLPLNSSRNATCEDRFEELEGGVSVTLPWGARLANCSARCLATVNRTLACRERLEKRELDVRLTFWLYLSIRVFIGIIGGTAFAMFEGAVIAILREQKADYGLQRIYATIGGMISSPLSGALIDYFSKGKPYTDFRPAFYLYAALKIASGLLILTISLEFKTPAKNVVTDVLTVLRNVELLALLCVIFVLGTAWGYIESFLFWLLQDLGGSRSLMGVTITVAGLAGIPLLVLSGPIIESIGHANVLFIGFVFYAIRLFGYSLIYNPWLCLIFEAMESVTSSLSFTAAVTYAAKLSTTTTDTSIQGLLGGLYFGVGKGAGSLVGGYLMKGIGTRPTYQVFAAMCAVVGTFYFFFNKFYLRRRPQVEGNDIIKDKIKFMDGGEKGFGKSKKNKNKEAAAFAIETSPINKDTSKSYSANEVVNASIAAANFDTTAPAAAGWNVNHAYEDTEGRNATEQCSDVKEKPNEVDENRSEDRADEQPPEESGSPKKVKDEESSGSPASTKDGHTTEEEAKTAAAAAAVEATPPSAEGDAE
ncbi:major facilitator superfamily domain-containing protein 6-like [Schistocerca americana]|uniref:major facilitator superfamily domain-containing protein 6-like n=1 Tax=Schistocerca americana TaxID=7009 RepID=UPI001F4F3D99|nr:major facilitator superfamily domain-containing protein 6-like [Schistocerca americana]XP_046981062.1 major facilitator superfamily domain-containing protein 6-like [Schistocerca americana]